VHIKVNLTTKQLRKSQLLEDHLIRHALGPNWVFSLYCFIWGEKPIHACIEHERHEKQSISPGTRWIHRRQQAFMGNYHPKKLGPLETIHRDSSGVYSCMTNGSCTWNYCLSVCLLC